jgi:thiol-disulfide isomerase/thioredoxin
MQTEINELIKKYVFDPNNAEVNFDLALYYDNIGQLASAVSYYLRSAERTDNDLLKYEGLLRASTCFSKQGSRNFTVKGLIQHAIATCPKRPEAYFYMSRFYEFTSDWHECYLISSIGLDVSDPNSENLRTKLDYPGFFSLKFMRAVSGWWCGLCDDSRKTFIELVQSKDINEEYRSKSIENLCKITSTSRELTNYNKSKYDSYKFKFPGLESIERNYSESYQDMFVLSMLNGKKRGKYLEIGSANPFYGNNTALLETEFGWDGVSLDIDEKFVEIFSKERKNLCLLKDATRINYENFLQGFGFYNEIDYLQLDCDPPDVTYKILLSIPFEQFKFAVITYEHDYYCDQTKQFQEKSKKYLESYGYVRVVNNISPDEWRSYEDWWVHPDLVDKEILNKMTCISDKVKKSEHYMLGLL